MKNTKATRKIITNTRRALLLTFCLVVTSQVQAYTSFTLSAKTGCEIASGNYLGSGNGFTATSNGAGVLYCEVEIRTPTGTPRAPERYLQVQTQIERNQSNSRSRCWITGNSNSGTGTFSNRLYQQTSNGNTSIDTAIVDTWLVDMATLGCFIDSNDTLHGYRVTQN